MVAELAAGEVSNLVGYTISPADLDWRGESTEREDLALSVADSPGNTIRTLAGFSGRDMRRRDLSQESSTTFVATAFADPVLSSITRVIERVDAPWQAPTTAGAMIRDMTATFRRLDARFGSAELRPQVVAFLHDRTKAIVNGRPDRDVFSALSELAQFAGWLAQDCELQATAQRYYIQALVLAEHADDAMLAGRALSAMSDQAARMGHPQRSLALARAAIDRSLKSSAPTVKAMLHDKHAWALARVGDEAGCTKALISLEKTFSAPESDSGPAWASHYNEADIIECHGHCFRLLRKSEQAIEYLVQSRVKQSPCRTRTRSYAEADLALAYLWGPRKDVDAALDAGGRALDLANQLTSTRITDKLHRLDTAFASFDHVAVREWRARAGVYLRNRQPGLKHTLA
jgi:tetratricopeptide (TPR) repeat protein